MGRVPLALLIPILALLIPVCAIVFNGLVKIAKYRALGAAADGEGGIAARLAAVEEELLAVRHELADTQERLDFAERLLARPADAQQLPRE
jgi:hypothetical protein